MTTTQLPPTPPPALRNGEHIRARLVDLLPGRVAPGATVLEIASGSGHHATLLAEALPQYTWQPSEQDAAGRAVTLARVDAAALENVNPPIILDVLAHPWPLAGIGPIGAVLCINMIHISPWDATVALFAGAAAVLPAGGLVVTYGPYRIDGDWGAESNRAFDASLRSRNPAWGVRELGDIVQVAGAAGFALLERWPMPANNFILAFIKSETT